MDEFYRGEGGHCRTENVERSLYNARICTALEQNLYRISFTLPVGLRVTCGIDVKAFLRFFLFLSRFYVF